MFRSMTAYVYRSIATNVGQLTIELQSLNRKHLEVMTYLQKELSRYETDVKKLVGNVIKRGQINVRLSLQCHEISPIKVSANLSLAKQLREAWEEIARALGMAGTPFDLHLLKEESGLFIFEDTLNKQEEFKAEILNALQQAVEELISSKEQEGKVLFDDIEGRVGLLATYIETITEKAGGAVERYRQKLIDRLEEVRPGSIENEERILREICLFAEKIDIVEEIIRFRAHIALIRQTMNSSEIAQGKKLEFILQEMGREVNTIGSKCSDVELSHLVVEMKSELEKIREQIQNIE